MSKKNVPFDLTNFFVNRDKSMFFVHLLEVEKKKKTLYQIRRKFNISRPHSKLILSGLFHFNLFDEYYFDSPTGKYIIKFSPQGLELRKKILEIKPVLEKIKIWQNV